MLKFRRMPWLFVWLLFGILGMVLVSCKPQSTPIAPTIQPEITSPPINTATVEQIPAASDTAAPTATDLPSPTPLPPSATPTITSTPTPSEPSLGSTRTFGLDDMEQVFVPAGEFIMGSDSPDAKRTITGGRAYPEIPVNTVYLDGFWIDKFEVTTGQYASCVDEGVCRAPWATTDDMYPYYYGNPEFANYPVVWINWSMARTYCEWAGRRLPTEAEWEKAARGTDGRTYPWGNDPISGERANFCDVNCNRTIANGAYDDGYVGTAPVGSYPAGASPYGAMDMAGNVWEWTASLIAPYPYDANDGREDLDAPGERSWRGAPYSNGIWWMRSSVRYRSVPSYWWMNLGFRCASSK